MRNQIVILAAGKGTRMDSGDIPKVLVMLKNKPIILYVLEEIEKINQLAKPIIVVGYMYQKVREVLGDGYIYAIQDKQLGTGHALMAAKHKASGENILVLYGDAPFVKAESLKRLMALHYAKSAKLSMFTTTAPYFDKEFSSFLYHGRIIRNSEGKIVRITEYKDCTEEEKKIMETNPGFYMFDSAWLWSNIDKVSNKNAQGEYYLTDMVELAIEQGIEIQDIPVGPHEVVSVNSLEDLKVAESLL